MNSSRCCWFIVCLAWAMALLPAGSAVAQRVRFGAPTDSTAASDSSGLPDGGTWIARVPSNSATVATSSTTTAAPPAPVYTWSAAPAGSIASPSSMYASAWTQPSRAATGWDPYQMASRPAAFSGNITSASGQFVLPQPMPRVPYYTQQPVANTAQPYVVIPEPGCAVPVMAPSPVVMSGPTSAVAVPAAVPAPIFVPQAIPTLAAPVIAPVACPRCYGYVDGIFFTRDARIGNTPLVLLDDNAATQSNVLLSTADLDFEFEIGPRILLGREFDAFRAFEASYFGIFNWQDTTTINGDNNLNLPGDLGLVAALDFFNADRAVVDYETDIHNAEFNYVRSYQNLSWLAGFRYFHLGETFSLTYTDQQTGTSAYRINAYNNLFGGQLGGRVQQACGNFSYDLTAKSGVFYNVIRSAQNVADFDGFVLRDVHNEAGQVAFIGDVGFNGSYQFSQCISLRGGYQVFWIEGVALAPNQLDYTDTPASGTTLNSTGGLFMHGAHAGLMARW